MSGTALGRSRVRSCTVASGGTGSIAYTTRSVPTRTYSPSSTPARARHPLGATRVRTVNRGSPYRPRYGLLGPPARSHTGQTLPLPTPRDITPSRRDPGPRGVGSDLRVGSEADRNTEESDVPLDSEGIDSGPLGEDER